MSFTVVVETRYQVPNLTSTSVILIMTVYYSNLYFTIYTSYTDSALWFLGFYVNSAWPSLRG